MKEDDVKFGKTAMNLGFIDSQKLANILRVFAQESPKHPNISISQWLVHRGFLSHQQIEFIEKCSFGRYRLVKEIGRGGMGRVYKAYDPKLDRVVALKLLESGGSEVEVERFRREAKAMASLKHPNIVGVFDIGNEGQKHFFAMDFIEGESLSAILQNTRLTSEEIVDIMIKVGDAIHYAHRQGIIHRDLKPANVMLTAEKEPKVTDFGLAKLVDDKERLSQTGTVLGTLQYMPPEQAEGKIREINSSSDVYSLGAILYEILTKRPPFNGSTMVEIILKIVSQDPVPPTQIKSRIPKDLEKICLKALQKEKKDRYPSAASMVDDLVRLKRGESVQADEFGQFHRLFRKLKRHRKWVISACVLFIVLVTFVSLWFYIQGEEQRIKNQQKIARGLDKAKGFLKTAIKASNINEGKNDYSEIPRKKEEYIKKALVSYTDVREELEDLLKSTNDPQVRSYLFKIEKEIGLLALVARNYVLSELSFRRCKSLGKEAQAQKLMDLLKYKRDEVKNAKLKRVAQIMKKLAEAPPEEGMIDEYVTEIVKMRGREHVIRKLLRQLYSGDKWQRLVVIEALGKIGEREVVFGEKDVGQWLLQRLINIDTIAEQDEAERLVWALGRLRDTRAEDTIMQLRVNMGEFTPFWNRTAIPYSWIPIQRENKNYKHLSTAEAQWKKAEGFSKIAWQKMRKGDFKGALVEFNRAIKLAPNEPTLYNNRGVALMRMGRYKEAKEDFNVLVKLRPNYAIGYANRADIHRQQGKLAAAIRDYSRALSINPNISGVYINRGTVRNMMGDVKGAFADYDKVIKLTPEYALAYSYRGKLYGQNGQLEKAKQDFRKALRKNPQNATIYKDRGIVLHLHKDYKGAIADYSKSLSLDAKDAETYYNRGSVYQQLKKTDRALKDYNRAIQLDSKLAIAYKNRAILYQNRAELKKAKRDYRMYVKLNPQAPDAKKLREYFEGK